MMPGMTNLPVPSMVRMPAGIATFVPTAVIFPFRTTIVPFWMSPPVIVISVALRIATSWARERGRRRDRCRQRRGRASFE